MIAAMLMLSMTSPGAQEDAVVKAFEHYEGIRVALSSDRFTDVAGHAGALAPMVEGIAGAAAKAAVDALQRATDIKQAREHFGTLSTALIPAFEKRALDDVYFYRCSMVNQSWAQRGKLVQNPYMGSAMAACGSPLKPTK
ncbi:MAG: hypothetical protein ABIZ92_10020 [Vicinamibacterales bacterium]